MVLDAYGVIYDEHGVREPLIPFLQEQGCTLSEVAIWQQHFEVQLGHCSYPEFWERVGLGSTPADELFEATLQLYSLTPGLLDFLASMRALKLPVACLSNDAADFSLRHRQRYGLEELIDPWIISGNVGKRKPDRAIFGLLLLRTGLTASDCLLADDRIEMLDAARAIGFQTAHFGPAHEECSHPHMTNFQELDGFVRSKLQVSA